MTKIAQSVGMEQFVVDDGWFKNRIDEKHALGDWVGDKNKFLRGFKAIADNIRKIGMDFGFWVEPKKISPDSDLYRAHPEYASALPH